MKRILDADHLTEFFVKAGLILALAITLLMPTTVRVDGTEASSHAARSVSPLQRTSWDRLPLPPIPHLDTMPWLLLERTDRSFKIDTLLAPSFELLRPAPAQAIGFGTPATQLQSLAQTSRNG